MDSLTQIALGAAFGEATIGHKNGRKGALWGAVLGTLPDLDIVANLFLDPVDSLAAHRAASHSFVVALLVSPIIALLLRRLHIKDKATRGEWTLMVFLVWATHIFVDLLTVYGTQIFWPFSRHPFGIDSIFIIDPLYTLPLAMGVLFALRAKVGSRKRFRINAIGLVLSTLYLTWGMSAKLFVHSSFKQGLASRGIQTERVMTAPTPLNTVLWQGLALESDTLHAGLYSVLDSRTPSRFTAIPRQSYLLNGHREDRAVARMLWFSKGWYVIEEDSLGLTFADYRFGRSDSWLRESGSPIFHWRLIPDSTGAYTSFQQLPTDLSARSDDLKELYERARGN
ncbi:MAG: metal-dependent hydrolase [Bacteroidetes bacterium]|nr:metal-dependent hydrolase [Bacteroidota bacterium]MDA0873486.1 metal-dependent hydrolase [Bacteroidota bacterium]